MNEKRKVFAQALTGLALSGFMSIAMADPPLVMERFENSGGPFMLPPSLCGFDVLFTFEQKGKFTLFADNTARLHVNVETVFSNAETGTVLIETAVINRTSPPALEIVDEDAGTLTVIFTDTFNGLPFRWYQPGTGVLLRDAGTVTFQGSLVLDLETGDFISFSQEIVDEHGPHPSLVLSFPDQLALFCGALSN